MGFNLNLGEKCHRAQLKSGKKKRLGAQLQSVHKMTWGFNLSLWEKNPNRAQLKSVEKMTWVHFVGKMTWGSI